ncbi:MULTISPECIES: tetratricopeptide repeat protein [unclassified Spirosoma]|uniref:tetratricopeptide repeat protein n=1 Tax=unclassified Spirosoma TaxID=2621999 RepID=UPI00096782BC|nr:MULTISPECIES: tetratricopeptide repeat protein [unclassified Spirosoma]MBN8821492.1 tetratricopeptide repeat protein [Spirosoma sp.]OJW78272.1 MAG: histidine kinase [Spirosoma sp. 48-14]
MKPLFLLIGLSISSCPALAQINLADSLQNLLARPIPDTSKVLALDRLSRAWMYAKPFEAMQCARKGLQIAQRIGYARGEARIQNRIGTIFRLTGNFDQALTAHLTSINIAEANQDKDALARTYNNLGNLYIEQNNWTQAIRYLQKALALAEELKDSDLKQIVLTNLGYDYISQSRLDSALKYTTIAYQEAVNLKTSDRQAELMNLGNVYGQLGKYKEALQYFRFSVENGKTSKNARVLSQTYYEMADVFNKMGQKDSTIFYANQSLTVAQRSALQLNIVKASSLLTDIYESTDPRQAIAYLKIATAAKDSLVNTEKIKNFQNIEFNEKMRHEDEQRLEEKYRTRITIYLLVGAIGTFIAIAFILYRNNRIKQKANVILKKQRDEISVQRQKAELALTELKATQNQLIQREKLASLGELTAGIAHEIQNPLNFVTNFSEVSTELIDELGQGPFQQLNEVDKQYVDEIIGDLRVNLEKINYHGKRADAIVRGMLEHSRTSTGEKAPIQLNKLTEEHLNLAFQGYRSKVKEFTCQLERDFGDTVGGITIVAQDVGRVLLNLFSNAFYAMNQKRTLSTAEYQPVLWVSTRRQNGYVEIRVKDNGAGIPEGIKAKIFHPFFTSKPTGEGTGLGLSLSFDIITKGHSGELTVDSREGEGTEFIIRLPG